MGIILLALLVVIVLAVLGFVGALHVLWWIAIAALVIWLLGFLVRMGEGAGRRRWYRW
jgi:hypothetical protein